MSPQEESLTGSFYLKGELTNNTLSLFKDENAEIYNISLNINVTQLEEVDLVISYFNFTTNQYGDTFVITSPGNFSLHLQTAYITIFLNSLEDHYSTGFYELFFHNKIEGATLPPRISDQDAIYGVFLLAIGIIVGSFFLIKIFGYIIAYLGSK
jgi:hypothetical protein